MVRLLRREHDKVKFFLVIITVAVALKKRNFFEEDSDDDGPSITIDDATLDKILSEASKADERNSLID